MLTINIDKFSRNLIFTLYLLYYSQGSLYTSGSVISKFSLFLIILLGVIYLIKTLKLKKNKSQFYFAWLALLFLNVIGFVLTGDYDNSIHFNMFKNILTALIGFFPFYYLSIKDLIQPKHFNIFFFVLLPVTILQFFTNQTNVMEEYNTENPVNNIAYSFVALVPFLFFIKKRVISLILILILSFFLVKGAKRGALIAGSLGVIVYIYYLLKSTDFNSKAKQLKIYFFTIATLGLTSYYAYKQFLANEFFMKRMEQMAQGNTSHRIENYSLIFDAWYSSKNMFNLIFGFGFASSLDITGRSLAHNDWLELLSNFGLIGILIYSIIIISVLSLIRKKVQGFQLRMMLLCILLIWLFTTTVSMWYTSLNTFVYAILLGYIFGENQRDKY